MTTTQNLRVAVVGAGMMGADHVRRITAKISNADVVAVVEPDQARAAAAAALAPGAITAASFDEALEQTEIDAVIIATPGFLHEPILVTALERGLTVLCEKPLTTSAEDSLRIVELEQQHAARPVIQVGFMRRFDAGYQELKALRESGANGALLALHHAHRNPTTPPNFSESMLIHDSVIHEIDIIPFLTGEAITSVEVKKPRKNSLAPADLPEPQFVLFTTESGTMAIVEINVNAQFGYQVTTDAVFESGVAYIGRDTSLSLAAAGATSQGVTPSFKERFGAAYDEEVQRWVDAARTGGIDGPSAWDGYTASVVAEVAVRAQQSGAHEVVEYAVTKPAFYDETSDATSDATAALAGA
ncbi:MULTISPECIES: Gfo/Idh/MocA family protein [Curtobacterium]|uniref:Gfo/Idh/MocA family protein n=1 Tax=Curtobacterium TaxID=2034 RepID=UPI00048A14F3|nr:MULTISPECIES: Gfo/Idh/MocA family oxidoreductase [Curtobacterium]MBT1631223.1 Gfo/Idh/MocA family oxidoreductase [Curtobacterium flaccumfaciens pv. oortii]MCS5510665.1 Gfo/Idh/MocA family oxidoreductase [Curtobacterium flaccumfaciens pv. flaccumfaciens]MCX2785571.1 Gfo/Idh/MocA family oxidoreductase [Curtobacterium flaccumfaciens pv. flaccumfaciens]MCX2845424.1 Gfo/Idh/MocA family oxidoreductase [Curtobacterium flaccumfaciens pv. oortii]